MRLSPVLSAFAVSAAAGFAAVSAGRESFRPSKNTVPGESGTGGNSAAVPAAGKNAAGAANGATLALQFRKLLGQLGLDPSWAEGLAAADTFGFPELLEKMGALPDAQKEPLREFLLGRWAALDPAGGVAFFNSRKDEDMLAAFFRQWQRLDFPTAAARAEELGGKILRRTLRDKALLDPAGLLAWLTDRSDLNPLAIFSSGGGENTQALIRLAETAPDKMLAWARRAPEDQWDRGFIKSLAAQLAKHSPEEALAWAKSIKNPAQSAAALTGVADTLTAGPPERVLSLLAALPEAEDYEARSRLYKVIQKLDLKDAGKAVEWMRAIPAGETRTLMMQVALENLLESDPAAAFRLSETPGLGQGISWLTRNIPAAAKTPEGARRILDAAEGAKDSAYREAVSGQALVSWLEKDSRTLAAWLREKGGTPLPGAMRETLQTALAVQQRRDGGADAELLAIVGMPPEVLVKSQMLEDPASAARGLETVQDPEARHRLAGDIAKQFVFQDRTQAMAWAETVKDPEVQATAWKTIAEDWVREDSWQASQWIAKLPEGRGRDSAVLAMAEGISRTDPDLAWKWALSMGDSSLKNEALATSAEAWARKDAAALREALTGSGLAPSEQQAVLEKLKNGPEAAK